MTFFIQFQTVEKNWYGANPAAGLDPYGCTRRTRAAAIGWAMCKSEENQMRYRVITEAG